MKRLLRYVFITIGLLVAAVVIAYALGMLLPRRHVAATSAVIHRSIDDVWLAVSDMAAQASWRSDLKGVQRLPDHEGHPVWLQTTKMGGWPLEITEVSPPNRMVAAVADSSQGFGGTWTYELVRGADGTGVTLTEHGFIDSPLFRFLARFVFGLHASQEMYLRDLGRHFGENVTPTKQD